MREIGVRELKQSLSKTLRSVSRGEHIRVTLRGRPVADLLPAGAVAGGGRWRRLVADGRIVPPSRAHPAHSPPMATATRHASALVLAERDAER